MDYKKITSYIFKPAELEISNQVKYQKAYDLWSAIWSETFKELISLNKLYSDDFIRSHEISALYYGDEPVSVFLYNRFQMNCQAYRDLSYFKNYPDDVFNKLNTYESIMTMGYLTVSKEWRKDITKVSFSDIHVGLAVKRFMASKEQALVSFTRNNRKINDVVYRFGAKGLLKDHTAHNVSVDYIMIDKDGAQDHPETEVQQIINYLWDNYQNLQNEKTSNLYELEGKRAS